jgi:HTH-type transcriptional regulator / antitoxin HigA
MPTTTKTSGKTIPTFNSEAYANLLCKAMPRVITTEEEYDRQLAIVEPLHFNKQRTPEERALYKLLVILIEAYEESQNSMPSSPPHELLQFIMESNGLRQTDLVALGLGSSGVVSEIVNGKRSISKAQAKILADRFNVSPSLFI